MKQLKSRCSLPIPKRSSAHSSVHVGLLHLGRNAYSWPTECQTTSQSRRRVRCSEFRALFGAIVFGMVLCASHSILCVLYL